MRRRWPSGWPKRWPRRHRAFDAASNGRLIPQDTRVAYVSNGNPITGKQYVETLGRYYASLKTLDFSWDKCEVVSIRRRRGSIHRLGHRRDRCAITRFQPWHRGRRPKVKIARPASLLPARSTGSTAEGPGLARSRCCSTSR
jgi:hypothetical protein